LKESYIRPYPKSRE